jgi:molybdenum cofactor cytidylyltransferase
MTIALVVLAAGASSRLGTCKALVDLAGATPLARLLAAGRGVLAPDGAPRPLVVTGADHDAIARAAPTSVDVLANPDWSAGRLGGVAHAAQARADSDLCLAPVDVPLVPAEVFAALRSAWIAAGSPPRGWLAPCVARAGATGDASRAYGHPIVIGRELAARAGKLGKNVPLRELRALAVPLLSILVDSTTILDDLDDPADLERLRRRIS